MISNFFKGLFIFTVLVSGLFLVLSATAKVEEKITQEQAIRLAEDFIQNNGYTKAKADTARLSFELFDQFESNLKDVLKKRHNTLQPKAFCISEREDKWYIGFLSAHLNIKKLDSIQLKSDLPGRDVVVSKDGKEIKISHKDPMFSRFKKLNP